MIELVSGEEQLKFQADYDIPASRDPILLGTVCALASAVFCTAANICLRAADHCDPFWVSSIKAAPTMLLSGLWLLWRWRRGQSSWPGTSALVAWIIVGLVTQLLGNVTFQYAMGLIGMTMAVPLTFGTVIFSGALLGRFWLGEPITMRATWAMTVLSAAIVVLSIGANTKEKNFTGEKIELEQSSNQQPLAFVREGPVALSPPFAYAGHGGADPEYGQRVNTVGNTWQPTLGVAAACVSGLAYALLGVVLRQRVKVPAPLATMLFIVSTTGFLSLGLCSLLRAGMDGLRATSVRDFGQMWWAGVFNAAAFFVLCKALELAPVAHVNAVNSTQTAFSALAGIFVFGEAFSPPLAIGIGMTLVGLIILNQSRSTQQPAPD